jgi:hypothetical protein
MNHSIATADRTTHLKVVVVALIGATLVAGVGIAARVSHSDLGTPAAHLRADVPVIKIGGPVVISTSGTTTIR